jgi:dienelactone hydrolase
MAGGRYDPALHVARNHPMRYYLTLPKRWTPARQWPVLLTIEGSGRDYVGNHRAFVAARGDTPYIVVTPVIASNYGRSVAPEMYDADVAAEVRRLGGPRFDLEGLEAVLADVQRDFSGEPQVYLTGFSAGGHLTWLTIIKRPAWVAAAVPAAANFVGRGIDREPTPAPAPRGPIHVIVGDRDHRYEFMKQETADASRLARAIGYREITQTVMPGAGHQRFVTEAFAFLDSVRVAREGRGEVTPAAEARQRPAGPAARPS